jgi:hypothetical protein
LAVLNDGHGIGQGFTTCVRTREHNVFAAKLNLGPGFERFDFGLGQFLAHRPALLCRLSGDFALDVIERTP